MKNLTVSLAMIALSLVLFGCASTQFNREAALQVREGMTESDVERLLGKPTFKIPREGFPNVTTSIWQSGTKVAQVIFRNGLVLQPPRTTETSDAVWIQQQTENEISLAKKLADLRRQDYLQSKTGLTPDTRDAISKGQLTVGMSEADVRASWGNPDRVNRTGGVGAPSAQMVYGASSTVTYYVYLVGGLVTQWQSLGGK